MFRRRKGQVDKKAMSRPQSAPPHGLVGALRQGKRPQAGRIPMAAMMITNIRGYVGLCEQMDDQEVVELLKEYFTIVYDCADKEGGVLDKYLGDIAIVVFGILETGRSAAQAAVEAALEIRDELHKMNLKRVSEGRSGVPVGIAIHNGDVIVGNVGSDVGQGYTAIGGPVNVVNQLSHCAEGGQILITDNMQREVCESFETAPLADTLKIGNLEVTTYNVIGHRTR